MTTKTKTLNDGLIEAIKEKIPQDLNLASVLMDTLFMGKEAAYRRLRGDVPFSFTEASIISQTLGVSLDAVSCNKSTNNALFGLNFINYTNPMESYYLQNENLIHSFDLVKDDHIAIWATASNVIPQVFYLNYDHLSKFLLFKWMYQHEKINNIKYFSEITINKRLRGIQKRYVTATKNVATTIFIWDNMMFYRMMNDIKYFTLINLITPDELKDLKSDIHLLLDDLEIITREGGHPGSHKVHVYVSSIDFDATYSCLENAETKISFIRVYSLNMISTMDLTVYDYQKNWIQSLKRYSTLISESGEMQRIEFFSKQRKYLDKILN